MKLKFRIQLLLLSLFALPLQNSAQQVINSAGSDRQLGTSAIYISDNVGEPFTQTFGPAANMMITQGYLQPYFETPPEFTKSYGIANQIACKNKTEDAFIQFEVVSSIKSYTPVYYWTPSKYCPNNNCSKIDSLQPGAYSLKTVLYYRDRLGALKHDTIKGNWNIFNSDFDCQIKVYTGITANNDGINETWQIDDIDKYPNNKVTIYNRWGYEVFQTTKYDNKDNAWPRKEDLPKLTSTTYFYILELGDGSPPRKAWLELIKD